MKIFIPSWVKNNPTILLNNKLLGVNAEVGPFCTIEREWDSNDKVRIDFTFDFRIEKNEGQRYGFCNFL